MQLQLAAGRANEARAIVAAAAVASPHDADLAAAHALLLEAAATEQPQVGA